jgi:tRNA(Met) C34 N-acetyltransferase TmcA
MELTTEQSHAIDRIMEWFKEKNEHNYRLSGYAGTGKSFLVGKFLNSLGKKPQVYCLAPSHKARRNLQGLIEGHGVDWIESQTVARFLGQSPKLNEETGFDEFVSDDGERIYADLAIADEYSMLSHKNLEDIQQKYSGKILFVGDPAQLPPVGEKRSPVLGLPMSESQLITSVRFTGEIGTVSASYRSS